MSKPTFTPGPWDCGYGELNNAYGVYTKKMLDEKLFESPICLVSPIDKLDETDKANARLIAAAPDMFEALQQTKKNIHAIEQEWDINEQQRKFMNEMFHTVREVLINITNQ